MKIIVFGNSTGNLVSWKKTLANILNYCNGILTKSKNGKFTKKEYLEYLFGIDDTFDEHDAFNMLYRFEIDFGKKSPPFEKTPTLTAKLYNFYKEFANYFSDFLSTDSGKEDRMQEIQQKITEIMSK